MPQPSSPFRDLVDSRAYLHYLRTGLWVDAESLLAMVERKFNPYHDEIGRFTSPPGVTVSYGYSRPTGRSPGSSAGNRSSRQPLGNPRAPSAIARQTSDTTNASALPHSSRPTNQPTDGRRTILFADDERPEADLNGVPPERAKVLYERSARTAAGDFMRARVTRLEDGTIELRAENTLFPTPDQTLYASNYKAIRSQLSLVYSEPDSNGNRKPFPLVRFADRMTDMRLDLIARKIDLLERYRFYRSRVVPNQAHISVDEFADWIISNAEN